MGARKQTYYVKEYPWQQSPEVWKSVGGWIIGAFIIGFIAALFVSGGDSAKRIEEKTAKYKAEISATCEPKPKDKPKDKP